MKKATAVCDSLLSCFVWLWCADYFVPNSLSPASPRPGRM